MPYLPPANSNPTNFPTVGSRDLAFQVRMIEAKWTRFFPLIQYNPIIMATTPATPGDPNIPVGEDGATKFDPLWNESVDPALDTWVQPHLSGTVKANDVNVYADAVPIRMRVFAEPIDGDLKDWGIEKKLDLTVVVPTSMLDTGGVTAHPGDWFEWEGDPYEVQQLGQNNRWMNTAAMLYLLLNCASKRGGS